jgi:hypothetical protein
VRLKTSIGGTQKRSRIDGGRVEIKIGSCMSYAEMVQQGSERSSLKRRQGIGVYKGHCPLLVIGRRSTFDFSSATRSIAV